MTPTQIPADSNTLQNITQALSEDIEKQFNTTFSDSELKQVSSKNIAIGT